jgi:cell division protein FtsI/penicillin-binding protein 2
MRLKDYKARVIIVFIVFLILFSIIAVRLFLLQITQKKFFETLAQSQHQVAVTINPARGLIYDRNGKLVAFNRESLSAFLLPREFNEPDKINAFLMQNYNDVYKKINSGSQKYFLWLDRKLSQSKISELKNIKLEDIHFINEPVRFYPYPSMCHILGFTNIDSQGISGIELEFDKQLKGKPKILKIQKDARAKRFYFEKEVENKGERPKDLHLTIDHMLQFYASDELKKQTSQFHAKSGAVLIMNPDTGEILAMANHPEFDPNQKIIGDLDATKNRIVTECFELGSVIKAFLALAALEEGVVTPEEEIDCQGKVAFIDGVRVENWKSVNVVPFYDVIKNSSNIGVAKVAKRLGPKYYEHLKRVGFGQRTGISFPGEGIGKVIPPEKWSRPSLIVLSFGYEMTATLLQLAQAFGIIANGGYKIPPVLLKEDIGKTAKGPKLYKDKTIEQMKFILGRIGENYPIGDCRVLGKTGTARIVENGHYSNKSHNYTFAGIVEKGNYKRVVIAFLREPDKSALWASGVAAPLFKKVAERMVMYENNR